MTASLTVLLPDRDGLAAGPASRPATQATSRPAAHRMPRPGPLEKFSDGWKTHRAVVKAIGKDSITVRTKGGGSKEDLPVTVSLKTDDQTRVLLSVPAPKPANVRVIGARPVRLIDGKLADVKPGREVAIAWDDAGRAALIVTVVGEDLFIVDMPAPPPLSAAMLEAARAAEEAEAARAATRPKVTHEYGTIVRFDDNSITVQRPARKPAKPEEETFTLAPGTTVSLLSFEARRARREPSTAPAGREDLKVGQHVNMRVGEDGVVREIDITWKGALPRRRPATAPAAAASRPAAKQQ